MAKAKYTKQKFIDDYIDYVLENNKNPSSIYSFCKHLGTEESKFYEHFSSLDALEKEIWVGIFNDTISRIHTDSVYAEYSVREKLLAFYYTMVELMKSKRSYIRFVTKKNKIYGPLSPYLSEIKSKYNDYVKELVKEGVGTGEIESRSMLNDQYHKGFWIQLVFLIDFWAGDESENFDKTDAAIEKAVNLSFDLLAHNPIDSLLDFGKFIFQNKIMH